MRRVEQKSKLILSHFLSQPSPPPSKIFPPSLPCTFTSSNRSRYASKTGQDALCQVLLSTTRTPASPFKSSFTGTNARAPPKQLSCITNRNHLTPSSTSARMKATSQTSLTLSTPIILSNGKPLKHSLMSSHSSPHVRPGVRSHQRAQSEPATPARGSVKNVLFAGEESLSTVRVFNASGKPVNGSERQAAVPVYAADCAPPAIRGALVMMWQTWTAFGIMIGYVMDLAFFNVKDPEHITGLNWRLMLGSVSTLCASLVSVSACS